jgi:putative SOS response-associated peptidase YedK
MIYAMCSNYRPVTSKDRMWTYFGVKQDRDEVPVDVFPTGFAPFIRMAKAGSETDKVVTGGAFGLLPFFAKEIAYGRRTYNARSETVATLASFKHAWARGQRCIVPAEAIYETNWETGKAVRWRIGQPDDIPMGIAGIYAQWINPQNGQELFSFAMLTVNADGHPVMQRFHKPEDEKRMVVVLDPKGYDAWLACSVPEAFNYLQRWDGPFDTQPDPLPLRAPRTVSGRVVIRPQPYVDQDTGELF